MWGKRGFHGPLFGGAASGSAASPVPGRGLERAIGVIFVPAPPEKPKRQAIMPGARVADQFSTRVIPHPVRPRAVEPLELTPRAWQEGEAIRRPFIRSRVLHNRDERRGYPPAREEIMNLAERSIPNPADHVMPGPTWAVPKACAAQWCCSPRSGQQPAQAPLNRFRWPANVCSARAPGHRTGGPASPCQKNNWTPRARPAPVSNMCSRCSTGTAITDWPWPNNQPTAGSRSVSVSSPAPRRLAWCGGPRLVAILLAICLASLSARLSLLAALPVCRGSDARPGPPVARTGVNPASGPPSPPC